MERLIQLYKSFTGITSCNCEKILGGGSNRSYYRLSCQDGTSNMIGVIGTSVEENNAFIALSKHFASRSLPVPIIYAVSNDGLVYLQTDLGSTSLYDALKEGRESTSGYQQKDISLLEKTIRLLPQMQIVGDKNLDYSICYPQESMDEQNILFDLYYFKYCFLKTTKVDFNEFKLEQCFKSMAKHLSSEPHNGFMYRDFQARNVMLTNDGEPHFIDFQGGRRGPLQYDLVSFLWQASSHFNSALREHLINVYLDTLQEYVNIDKTKFKASIAQWVLFRTLQVLGAYGFRGRYEQKKYFLDSIPSAIENLRDILKTKDACPYPYLNMVLCQLVDSPEFNHNNTVPKSSSQYDGKGQLKVRIFSFSYKKGIPADNTGNGGGYVFDCRSTHNPGKYEPYKKLTGLDAPVIDFLENDGEILIFLESVYKLADAHVERYMQRGFTSLMFCFGCTGGQHRSVYSAQHLAEHLNEKYGIEVDITHREQNIHTVLPSRWKAMIFAAGLGTRLKPLTDVMPKALITIGGKPLIEHVLRKLVLSGFNDVTINVHHFADMIEEWVNTLRINNKFIPSNIKINISDERDKLLDTGGGIVHAKEYLTQANPNQKVLIHNVDILSNVNLNELLLYSEKNKSDVYLLVSKRITSRYFIFDDNMQLVGWINNSTGEIKSPHDVVHISLRDKPQELLDYNNYHLRAFSGIHLLNTSILHLMSSYPDKFSITDFYINSCKDIIIKGYEYANLKILDVGKTDTIKEAELLLPQFL